jgi:carbonic anhydrase
LKTRKTYYAVGGGLALALVLLFTTSTGREAQFLLGGGLVNLGFRMQDHLERYDFEHSEDITPDEIWEEVKRQNALASSVRSAFPRTPRHPLVAIVACMDGRLDTSEMVGDTRTYYYVLRSAGSVLSTREQEMLELAVQNGVKLVVWTRHTDCAAENVAATPALREQFPALAAAVDEREARFEEFLARPGIDSRIAAGELAVKVVDVDTRTDRIEVHEER